MHRQPNSPPARRRARTAGRVAVGLVSLLVLTATGIASTMMTSLLTGLHTSDALDAGGPKSADGALNILLIGLDSRKDQDGNQLPKEILDQLHAGNGTEGGYNTNTLILIHLPAGGGRASAVSIPRDDYVAVKGIPGYTRAKIKEAYGLAKYFAEQGLAKQGITGAELETKGREAGRKETLDTVRDFLDLPIDRFAEVNLAGFYDLATALGGVEVCLNHPVHDDYSGADFPAGHQTLDGSQALSFVRQRHGLDNGDLDRTHRQQAFLASATHKLRDAGTFTDLGKLQDLIDTARKDVVVSAGWDVLSFAQQAQSLTGGNLEFSTLPVEGFEKVNGQEVNKVDVAKVRAAARTAFGLTPPAPPIPEVRASSTIDVRNTTGRTGLAADVAQALAPFGFRTGDVRNLAAGTSSIAYGPGAKDDAGTAASLLGGLPVGQDSHLPRGRVQITLGTGFTLPAALGPHGADTPPGAPAGSPAPPSPPSAGAPGGTVDGGGIPCVN
ncbi:LCP family protein [Amycolatopsis minnesotensis]|uniref:LCP family protein n=1 Tax=Amycolatopsis minnesotensis TaxID=337894 RepID=A0ABN2QTE6_9PSEU